MIVSPQDDTDSLRPEVDADDVFCPYSNFEMQPEPSWRRDARMTRTNQEVQYRVRAGGPGVLLDGPGWMERPQNGRMAYDERGTSLFEAEKQ